jgi:hypothetical protein
MLSITDLFRLKDFEVQDRFRRYIDERVSMLLTDYADMLTSRLRDTILYSRLLGILLPLQTEGRRLKVCLA